jgi:gliding motility-associated-like protein
LAIHDFEPTILEFESPVGICQGQAILEVNPISGYGPFEFLWNTGAADTLAVNTVFTNDPGSADVVVTDVCGNQVEATIGYTQPPELNAFISQLNEPLCAGDSVYLQSGINTGVGPFEYDWSTGGDAPTELVNFNSSTLVTLTITDPCGTEDVIEFDVEIPVYEPITGAEDDVCIGLQADLSLEGGTGEYTFFAWQYSNYDSDGIPLDSTWVEVNAALDSLVTFIGPFGNYQSTVQQGEMDVWVIDQCGSEAQFTIFLVACDTEIPNVFSPNNDTTNDFFRIPGIEGFPNSGLEVYNRWGNLIFQDNDYKGGWDGNVNGNPVSEGTYYYILKRSDDENFYGPLTIVRQRR